MVPLIIHLSHRESSKKSHPGAFWCSCYYINVQANNHTEESITVHVVAGVVLRKGNTFLMLEQAKDSAKGQWGLPAGKIRVDETAEQAAIREAKEESGYDVKIIQELGVYHPKLTGPVKHLFLAEVVGGEEELDPTEIASSAWLTLEEVDERKGNLRDGSIYTALVAATHVPRKLRTSP